jgi:WD40 repeat protein
MTGHKDSVTCFAEDGYFVMSGSDDMSIIIWNTGEWYSDLHGSSTNKIITPHKILLGHDEGKFILNQLFKI